MSQSWCPRLAPLKLITATQTKRNTAMIIANQWLCFGAGLICGVVLAAIAELATRHHVTSVAVKSL